MRILFLFALCSFFSQSEYSYLDLYRINAMCSGCEVQVNVNGSFVANINNTEHIELKFRTAKKIKVTISGESPVFSYDYIIDLKEGMRQKYLVKPRIPRVNGFKMIPFNESLLEYEFSDKFFLLD